MVFEICDFLFSKGPVLTNGGRAIKNGQSRESGNIEYTRERKTKQKQKYTKKQKSHLRH